MILLRYIISLISFGTFTNKLEYQKHPFYVCRKAPEILENHRKHLEQRMRMSNATDNAVQLFHKGFSLYKNIPSKYDGASGDVELHKIGAYTYDIGAIIHDYTDVTNYTTTMERIKLADKALIKVMEELGDPQIHIDKRKLVTLLAPVRFMLSRKRRKSDYVGYDSKYDALLNDYVGNYNIDYTPVYKWAVIFLIALVLILTNPFTLWVFNLFF